MEASLYVHVPFCRSRCAYCDFFSTVPGRGADFAPYVSAVANEAEFLARRHGIASWRTVYVGGGTPSVLPPGSVRSLFAGLFRSVRPAVGAEVTFEANPESVSAELLSALSECGVNRLSLGVQSLDDGALRAVSRLATSSDVRRALSLVSSSWRGRVSVDFIAGLPRQPWGAYRRQFAEVAEIPQVDHVSLYALTVEEGTPLERSIRSGATEHSEEMADWRWIAGRGILERLGFSQYEVSNFSRRGGESRHNCAYWRQESYVGAGAGAGGTVYSFGGGEASALRWTDTRDVGGYVEFWGGGDFSGPLPREEEPLCADTLAFEFLMLGFRTAGGVDAREFAARFGRPLSERRNSDGRTFAETFADWEGRGLASRRGDRLSLTRGGILLLNRFLGELL